MAKLAIQPYAAATLKRLFARHRKQYALIEKALDDLVVEGLGASNIKKLANTKHIFRKRAGRWRILFTFDDDLIRVWIIAIEKDTSADYHKWIFYIEGNT